MADYSFIGAGNMGSALFRALCKKIAPEKIVLYDKIMEKAISLGSGTGCRIADTAEEAADGTHCILLSVKPHIMPIVLQQIGPLLKKDQMLITMAPGITMDAVRDMTGISLPVIRIMPNMPAKVGAGVTLYTADSLVEKAELDRFLEDFAESGSFFDISENLMDTAGSITGCGPAFAFLFLDALCDGGVACGLARSQAYELASHMMFGAAKMAMSGIHPSELKDSVCSPGGTTIQGVRMLEKNGFRSAVMEAVIAALEKSKNM